MYVCSLLTQSYFKEMARKRPNRTQVNTSLLSSCPGPSWPWPQWRKLTPRTVKPLPWQHWCLHTMNVLVCYILWSKSFLVRLQCRIIESITTFWKGLGSPIWVSMICNLRWNLLSLSCCKSRTQGLDSLVLQCGDWLVFFHAFSFS